MEPRSRRGRPRIYSSESERLRIRRQRETSQERATRLDADAARHEQRRRSETLEERNERLRDSADRQRRRRQHESLEERTLRLLESSQREQERRDAENAAQRSIRLERNAQRERRRRESENIEQRAARLTGISQRLQRRRESENADERRTRLQENALRQQIRRESEDVVERQARLQENAQRQRRRRDSEGVEELQARLRENAQRQQARRESEGVEERQARLRENAQRQQARRESEGVEERQARLRENAQRQRARRESENVVERQMRLQEGFQRQMRRRQRESSEERRTRLQSNAQIQQRRRASERLEDRELRSQAEAMRLQRRREFESTEARTLRQQEDTQRHRRRRTQESERERSVRLQSNALANRQRRSRLPESTGAALLSRITEVNYLGELNRRCVNCGALHFPCEVKTSHPGKFRECCDLGRFTLNVFESFPEQLRRLFVRGPDSTEEFRRMQRNFLENIRNFNSALAMASMGAQVETLQGRGPYCYRIHGQVYHRLGPLHPRDGEPRQYGQIYILDTELAAQERLGDVRNSECEPGLMRFLSGLLASVNVYAQSYKMMYEVEQMEIAMAAYENRAPANIRMVFEESSLRGLARRPYDLPTANEVAVIYVGEDNDVPTNRSLAVHLRSATGEQPRNISDIDKICDPLTYPLLFPTGEGGWEPGLRNREGTRITQKEYYAYLFSIRDSFNPILFAGKLCQQFAVDAYVKIEQNRLNFQRRNQLILRRETFRGLQDYLAETDNSGPPGSRVVLSSSHAGSPRAMQQAYQDAMAIVARYGRPTFFLTMTCNPQWKELRENLYYGQSPSDRPDLVARVFNAKLQELCTDLFKRNVLGEVEAYVYVVEFQKRGLPHCHMLLIMRENWRARTAEEVDKAVCAEIPNSEAEPELYAAVTSYMIHRQCGAMDPRSPCMQDGSCARRFPKQIRDRTTLDNDGYPNYRRRNLFPTEIQGIPYTDEWVVPFNPYLLLKYDCHINLEICGMISAVKYLYKYIYKGPDRARISIENQPTVDDNQNIDEIKQHLNTRYVCAPQSMYRIFGYSMQGRSHAIVRLAVHLPELQDVQFVQGQEQQYLAQAQRTFTTLTAFFELNRLCNEMHERGQASDFRVDPRNIYYYQIPEHFTFDPRHGWTPRMRGGNQIGRMYTVPPRDTERFCLRILLLNTKGKTSFEDLRTVDGVTYDTYTEAAKVAGFLDDDRYYRQSLQEVAHYQSAATMRSFFACLLCFCEIVQAQDLWDEFSDMMSDDYVYQGFDRQHAVALAYFDVLDRVATMGRDLREVIRPPTAERPAILAVPVDYASYERSGLQQYETLNTKQREAADDILAAMYRADNRCIFIDGPGGSGKTYLYSTVYSIAVGRRHRVLCVAWTGIAANLLPGGRTVNSVFKLNISDGNRSSSMRRQQKEAQQLREADMINWDEISMTPKSALEAVDCLLRDIMQTDAPFGGKVIVIGGDFRQILPVVEHGQREDIVEACVLKSSLWRLFSIHRLEINMRARTAGSDWQDRLLRIGSGESNDEEGRTAIPAEMMCTTDIVTEIFGDVLDPSTTSNLCENAVLAPKNVHVQRLNQEALHRLIVDTPQDERIYKSVDEAIHPEGQSRQLYQVEYLNSLTPTGMPPHELHLKKGAIVMLLRNLDVANGLCNGTRLKVETLGRFTLGCRFICGERNNQLAIIPRIDNYWDQRTPFRLRRRQFPVRIAFAMTINKAQGQSFNKVGVFLPEDVFAHGQLYVALSRARRPDGIKVKASSNNLKNIVFGEVLQSSFPNDHF